MYRVDVRRSPVLQTITNTFTTNTTLTIPGVSGQSIYIAKFFTYYVGAANTVAQEHAMLDGATKIWSFASVGGRNIDFYLPIRIRQGNSFVATSSVSVNTVRGAIELHYFYGD